MWMPVCPRALCRRCHWEGWTGKTDWLAETILNTHPVIPGDRAALFRPKMLKAPPRIDDILISCTFFLRPRLRSPALKVRLFVAYTMGSTSRPDP